MKSVEKCKSRGKKLAKRSVVVVGKLARKNHIKRKNPSSPKDKSKRPKNGIGGF